MTKILVKSGANVNIQDKVGETPLHFASMLGKSDIVMILIELGKAKVNVKNHNQKTPLHLASEHGYRIIVYLLL